MVQGKMHAQALLMSVLLSCLEAEGAAEGVWALCLSFLHLDGLHGPESSSR